MVSEIPENKANVSIQAQGSYKGCENIIGEPSTR